MDGGGGCVYGMTVRVTHPQPTHDVANNYRSSSTLPEAFLVHEILPAAFDGCEQQPAHGAGDAGSITRALSRYTFAKRYVVSRGGLQ